MAYRGSKDKFDYLNLDDLVEKILAGKRKEILLSLDDSRNQEAKLELESLKRENEDLRKQIASAREDLRQRDKQIMTDLKQQAEVCHHSTSTSDECSLAHQPLNLKRKGIW